MVTPCRQPLPPGPEPDRTLLDVDGGTSPEEDVAQLSGLQDHAQRAAIALSVRQRQCVVVGPASETAGKER